MNLFENFFGKAEDDGKDRVKSTSRLTMRAVVGGYIAYLGYKLLTGGASTGEKPVPEWLRLIMGVLFMLAGIAFIGYAAYAFYEAYKKGQQAAEDTVKEARAITENSARQKEEREKHALELLSSERFLAVKGLYQRYIDDAEKAQAQSKPTDGLLGIGSDARNAPCHEKFYNALSEQVEKFAAEGIDPAEADVIVGYILRAPEEHKDDKLVFPMMYAAAGLAEKLVGRLDPHDADLRAIAFSEAFPKPERMPAQDKVLQALYDRARMI